MQTLITSQPYSFRLLVFIALFILFALLEWRFPRRKLTVSKVKRWRANLLLSLINSAALRLLPVTTIGFAFLCQQWQVGFFNLVSLPSPWPLLVCVLLLDLAIWAQHWCFHQVRFLWRFHKVHHADLNLDLSSAIRFHTVEILLSMGVKFVLIALLGASPMAVLTFELLLSSLALFNHSNLALPLWFDRLLRLVIVTPDMHRIHHSTSFSESNRNFGFCLSIWDRLFGCYCLTPKRGQMNMPIGLKALPSEQQTVPLRSILLMPFKQDKK